MKVSVSIELVWQLAAYEAIAGDFKEIEPEHFLMALLKFADLPIAELEKLGPGVEAVQALTSDVKGIQEDLQGRGYGATALRRAIRAALGKGNHKYEGGQMHRSQATRAYFEKAAVLASEAGCDVLTGLYVLDALFVEPPPGVAKAVASCPFPEKKVPAKPKTPVLDEFGKVCQKQPPPAGEPLARLAEAKAVIHALAQPRRMGVLLETASDALQCEVLASVASLLEGKEVPGCLKGDMLIDVSGPGVTGLPGERALACLQTMISEVLAAKNIILILPALVPVGRSGAVSDWATRLKAISSAAQFRFIARLEPESRREVEKDSEWRKLAQIITLQDRKPGNIPFEL